MATWIPESLRITPTVWITTTDTASAMRFFDLLNGVCYHPIIVTRLSPSGRITLFSTGPGVPGKVQDMGSWYSDSEGSGFRYVA
jgi:hypothetical protein